MIMNQVINISWLNELFSNNMLWNATLAWFIAQFIKILLHMIATKKLNLRLLFESGGMPSSHSAIICAICVSIGNRHGFDSTLFALASVVATIVMYDAMGVRRATGEQGRVLNKLIDMMNISDQLQTTLKEVIGHKPLEVLAGALLGILVGLLIV